MYHIDVVDFQRLIDVLKKLSSFWIKNNIIGGNIS